MCTHMKGHRLYRRLWFGGVVHSHQKVMLGKKNKGEMSTAPGDSLGTVLGQAGLKETHWWKLTAKYNYLKAVEYEELIHHRKPKVNPRVYNLSAGGAFMALNADLLPHTTKREDHYGLIWRVSSFSRKSLFHASCSLCSVHDGLCRTASFVGDNDVLLEGTSILHGRLNTFLSISAETWTVRFSLCRGSQPFFKFNHFSKTKVYAYEY